MELPERAPAAATGVLGSGFFGEKFNGLGACLGAGGTDGAPGRRQHSEENRERAQAIGARQMGFSSVASVGARWISGGLGSAAVETAAATSWWMVVVIGLLGYGVFCWFGLRMRMRGG